MADQHFEARLADAQVAIDHMNAVRRIEPASNLCAGWRSMVRGFMLFHATIIIGREAVRARVVLTVGEFPQLRFFPNTESVTSATVLEPMA
jgi:hypothetical protein